ncbi:MAG: hypothetical protein LN573_05545 [Rickettsia endosymbiont of Oxypoda opaca]|nr:hypothetical protein [Rickettsia endosymbiont of Oxypoda opaca]
MQLYLFAPVLFVCSLVKLPFYNILYCDNNFRASKAYIDFKNYLFNQLMKIIDVKYLIGNKNTMKFFLLIDK